jgi:hypothetical protein
VPQGGQLPNLDRSSGIDDDGPPVGDLGVLLEVEKDFRKQTAIEDRIALKLHLHKVNRSVWPVVGGQKTPSMRKAVCFTSTEANW